MLIISSALILLIVTIFSEAKILTDINTLNSENSTIRKSPARSDAEKKDLSEKIITKGRELFIKLGSQKFNLRLLAKELGMTHGNLYNYVESKRDLWIMIRRQDLVKIKQQIQEIIHDHKGTYIELINKITIYYLNYAKTEYRSFQMLFYIPLPKSDKISRIETTYDPVKPFDLIKEQIRKGIQARQIREVAPEYLSDLIFSLIHGAATMEIEFRI